MKATVRPFAGTTATLTLSPCHLVTLSLALLTGCDVPGRPDPADRPVPANEVLDFSVLYGQNCAGCHGARGKLGPAPPLNDPLFRAIVPEVELNNVLTKGRERTLMPAFADENGGPLTAAQIQVLVKEIKGVPYKIVAKRPGGQTIVREISPQWGLPGRPPKTAPSYLAQAAGAEDTVIADKDRNVKLFARACAICHGDLGRGMRNGDETVRTINDPVFLSLISDQALRRYVITGRPDLSMPSFAEARPGDPNFRPLTDHEVSDLVALLASWRRDHGTRPK